MRSCIDGDCEYCSTKDIPSLIVRKDAHIREIGDISHVVCLIGEERRVVDASYSQFLGYVGLRLYAAVGMQAPSPTERIISFLPTEGSIAAYWLTLIATQFRNQNIHPTTRLGTDLGKGPLLHAPTRTLYRIYREIWDIDSYTTWAPPVQVTTDARVISAVIPPDCISV